MRRAQPRGEGAETAAEIERLDALAAARGVTRSEVLRSALEADQEPAPPLPALTRGWTLEVLQRAAAEGSVTAAAALARELRLGGEPPVIAPGPIDLAELDSLPELRVVR